MTIARLMDVFVLFGNCDVAFASWDLEGIYSSLHSLKRVAYAKFQNDPSYTDFIKGIYYNKKGDAFKHKEGGAWERLEKARREFYRSKNDDQYNYNQIKFYNIAEEIYLKLNLLIKEHGIFFREGRDPRRAALRT